MKNQNPNREPSSNPNAILELFQNKKLILGDHHVAVADKKGPAACGPNCPHRLTSITCPFFTPSTPCLVGCHVKQILDSPGGNPTASSHREIAIFVTSQAGQYLIGEENIINLGNPRSSYLRVLTNKHGQEIGVTENANVSLYDLEPGMKISEGSLPLEGELAGEIEVNFGENKDAKA